MKIRSLREQRSVALERTAFQLDMQFSEKDTWSLKPLVSDFALFGKGRRRRIHNILQKRDAWHDTNIQIFDYEYRKGKSKRRHTYRQTVFFIQSKQLALPEFRLQPERFIHQIGALLGFEDIDFEAHPEFSRIYHLKGDDEEWIRSVFDKNLIQFFTIEKDWNMEGVGYYLVLYKHNHLMTPAMIDYFYKKGLQLCKLLTKE